MSKKPIPSTHVNERSGQNNSRNPPPPPTYVKPAPTPQPPEKKS